MKRILLGNSGVARGVYEAGATVVCAYPGTPSTEITEEIAKNYPEIYCEWAPNEKVATEVAIGASIGGARAMVCMKHVGVNVAADPIFTYAYTGVNGGMLIAVADDPGMHSSQNEQDSRFYARAAHIPMLEPSDSQEALDFVKAGFELSEKFDTPFFLRMTTRVSHSRSLVEISDKTDYKIKDYNKNVQKFVMNPANAKLRHIEVEKRDNLLLEFAEECKLNKEELVSDDLGIVCSGGVYQYVKEALPNASVFKLGLIHPLPFKRIEEFSKKVKRLIVIEELEPFFENQLKAKGIVCKGKELFSLQGELSTAKIRKVILGEDFQSGIENLPARPPVLCAGCPHRGVFYVLNKLKKTVFGDIGCYTLGAGAPLSSIDAVICMGASVNMALGMQKARGKEYAKNVVSVIGDSTFIHSGITGLIDAVYNKGVGTLLILDNSTTGMTGHQNHPAIGKTIRNEDTFKLSLEEICKAAGINDVKTVDAYDIKAIEEAIKLETEKECMSVIIIKRPCILLGKIKEEPFSIDKNKCKNCKMCLKIGCPALSCENGVMKIDSTVCTGCGVCSQVCAFGAITKEGK